MFETTADIAEYICRTAVLENLISGNSSPAADELGRAILKLSSTYWTISARQLHSAIRIHSVKRILNYGVLGSGELNSSFSAVKQAHSDLNHCTLVMNLETQIETRIELKIMQERLDAPMQRWDDSLRAITDKLDVEQRQKILQWISTEPYMQHHQQTKSEVLKGTGSWFLQHRDFLKWRDESTSSILWLRGIPGSGKSKLMSIAVDDAISFFQQENSPKPVYFYCSRNPAEPGRSDPFRILASIARQLATVESGGPIIEDALKVYQAREANGFADGSLRLDESRDLILKLLDRYKDATVTILVDGLDECNEGTRGDLLGAFEQLLQESSCLLKILLSSRDDQDIVYQMRNYPSIAISSNHSSTDIELFIQSEVRKLVSSRLVRKSPTEKVRLGKKITQELTKKADGMFGWVSLQLQALQKCRSEEAILERLGRLPRTLGDLYQELLYKMESFEAASDRRLARNSLSWILCSHSQLPSEAFLVAVSTTKERHHDSISRDQLLDLCCNLVIFDDTLNVFRFAHLSVREFLEEHELFRKQPVNARVSEACLIHITSATPSMDMTTFTNPSTVVMWYSYLYWGFHTQGAAEQRTPTTNDLLTEFLAHEDDPTSYLALWYQTIKEPKSFRNLMGIESRPEFFQIVASSPSAVIPACGFDIDGIINPREWVRLTRKEPKNRYNRSPVEIAIDSGSTKIISWMLDNHIPIPITVKLLVTAVWGRYGYEMMDIFFDKCDHDVQITENIVICAIRNRHCSYKLVKLLFDRRQDEIQITTGILNSMFLRWNSEPRLIKLILDRADSRVIISENMVESAAYQSVIGDQVIELLIRKLGKDFPVSGVILEAAARNCEVGDKVMTLLLKHYKGSVAVTERLVSVAAMHSSKTLAVLLTTLRSEIQVTSLCLEAAARYNADSLALLLEVAGTETMISETIVKAAAGNFSSPRSMRLLLEKRGTEFQVTNDIFKTAASTNVHTLRLLLQERPSEAKVIIENMVETAIQYKIREFIMFLEEHGSEIHITDKAVKLAASHSRPEVFLLLLRARPEAISITEDLLLASASPPSDGRDKNRDIVSALLKRDKVGTLSAITEKVCLTVAAGGDQTGLEYLCQQIPPTNINPDWHGICRLAHALHNPHPVSYVANIIKEPVPLDTKDSLGRTPLWYATYLGKTDIVRLLVEDDRVDVNSLDCNGQSPLFNPCICGLEDIVLILLSAEARTDFVDIGGHTALSLARMHGRGIIVELLEVLEASKTES